MARSPLTAALLCAALTAFGDASVPTPPQSAGKQAAPGKRIALTAEQARTCHGDRHPYVTPSTRDVQRLDASLVEALRQIGSARRIVERVPGDTLFYTATKDGFIQVEGFCGHLAGSDRRCPPGVDDGGDCVWRIRYNVKTRQFDQFGTNGDG